MNETNNTVKKIESIVLQMTKLIILHPQDFKLYTETLGHTIIFQASFHRDDMRRAIGRAGGNVQAVQVFARMAGEKFGLNIKYEIMEPTVGTEAPNPPFILAATWDSAPAAALASSVATMLLEFSFSVVIQDGRNGNSVCECSVDDRENLNLLQDIRFILWAIVGAVGKINGRRLSVDVVREGKVLAN